MAGISHEDLLSLTMKLSKRLKTTEAVSEKRRLDCEASELERDHIRAFVCHVLEDRACFEGSDDAAALDAKLRGLWASKISDAASRLEGGDVKGKKQGALDSLKASLDKALASRDDHASKAKEAKTAFKAASIAHEEKIVQMSIQLKAARDAAAHAQDDAAKSAKLLNVEGDAAKDALLQQVEAKLENALADSERLKSEFERLRGDVAEKHAALTRCEHEAQIALHGHASRTAELAAARREASEVGSKLSKRDSELEESRKKSELALKSALAQAGAALQTLDDERRSNAVAEDDAERDKVKRIAALEARFAQVEADAAGKLKEITEDYSKKSSVARKLVEAHDSTIAELRTKTVALEADAASGGHAHRKILEIAASQALREGTIHGEVSEHVNQIVKLRKMVKRRDGEVSDLQLQLAAAQRDVDAVKRADLRGGVNMEYVKNVILRYMTVPQNSSEQQTLIPVLATILQFTPEDVRALRNGEALRNGVKQAPRKKEAPHPVPFFLRKS